MVHLPFGAYLRGIETGTEEGGAGGARAGLEPTYEGLKQQ